MLPYGLSALALVVSLTALWKTHFARFHPKGTVGALTMRVYPWRNGNERWFVPTFEVPISVTNAGAVPGVVTGVRLVLRYPELPISDNKECVYAEWELDREAEEQFDAQRKWSEKAMSWMPFVVLPKTTVTRRLVFDTRWEKPVIQSKVEFALEVATGPKDWTTLGKWIFGLNAPVWKGLVQGGAFSTDPTDTAKKWREVNPRDLHKYTGSNEPLGKETAIVHGSPSYLEYDKPKAKKKTKRKKKQRK